MTIRFGTMTYALQDIPAAGAKNPFERLAALHGHPDKAPYDQTSGWTQPAGVLAHLKREVDEFSKAVTSGEPVAQQQDELGDVLYVASYLGLQQGLNPAVALDGAVDKFVRRFHACRTLRLKSLKSMR